MTEWHVLTQAMAPTPPVSHGSQTYIPDSSATSQSWNWTCPTGITSITAYSNKNRETATYSVSAGNTYSLSYEAKSSNHDSCAWRFNNVLFVSFNSFDNDGVTLTW